MAVSLISSDEQRVVLQGIQNRYVKIELLNYNFQTVDMIEGVATAGSISIDANADVRRTASVTLVVENSTFEVSNGSKVWLDKYLRIYFGTEDLRTGNIVYTNCGIYIIDAPTYEYNAQSNTLTLSLLDLMAKLTGVRNGYLKGVPIQLKAGENIRKAIIDTLEMGGFNKYAVEEAPEPGVIPNDIDLSQGSTLYDILSSLKDIYPNYEIWFDTNGVFHYNHIPTGKDEPISADDGLWNGIVITENSAIDFQNVKNSIEVYGRTHDPAHYATTVTVSDSLLTLTIESVTAYTEDLIYGFTLPKNTKVTNATMRINALTTLAVKNDDGTSVNIPSDSEDVYYCVQYKKAADGTFYFRWLGHLQAYGIAEDNDPNSPFYVEGTVGRIRLPLYDDEYANCITDELAQQRASFELWKHTNLQNTVQISTIPIPFLDVNTLVEYTSIRNQEKKQYIIKSISFGLAPSDNETISMMVYYPENTELNKL